ncbi:MAG: hypothetical protein JWM53_1053 [bacterium]|nr:hypothetical protein [bacterium]
MAMPRTTEPSLPAGFHSQPAYQFRDSSGRFSYEFSNVYGPPRSGPRGAVAQLDMDRSEWRVTGHVDDATEEQPTRRAVSYAEARRALRGHLTFAQFASEMHMRPLLPTLMSAVAASTTGP